MAKKKNKEESLVPKDEKTLKMEGVQNLYNFLFEACNILRGPVSQDNFKDYITPILYFKRISDVYDEETQTALEEVSGSLKRTDNKMINDFKLKLAGIRTEI